MAGVLTLFLGSANALALTADEIIKKCDDASYYAQNDAVAQVHMDIGNEKGVQEIRDFQIIRKDGTGEAQKFYVIFSRPGDYRNTVFMVHKHGGGKDDDRWLYLPSLDLVKRIAASDKRTSFVGSDYFYEDISGRGIHMDTFTLESQDAKSYTLKAVPKKKGEAEFDFYVLTVDKKTFLPIKATMSRDGKIYRTMEILETKVIQNVPTVTKARMSDLDKKTNTVFSFSSVVYNKGVTDIFTERYLRRPPKEYLAK
jgi:outer membrane lipoprotein-sorting protein